MSQQKFPMSQDIYNQIVWDARFDEAQFNMVYKDRRGTLKTKSVVAWDPYGDIPWHRVIAIEYRGDYIWDREARINILEEVLNRPVQDDPLQHGDFQTTPTYQFDALRGDWYANTQPPTILAPATLTMVTWNILFDLYDDDTIRSKRRWPSLCATLASTDADVIVLAEVTQPFLEYLLTQSWVCENYLSSDDIFGETIEPYGQLILSKYPMSTHILKLTRHKSAVLGRITWLDQTISVCAVHLPAGHTTDRHDRRGQQLSTIEAQTRQETNLIITGDFNLKEGEHAQLLGQAQWIDVWSELHPTQTGNTFAPSRNALARHNSQTQVDARYDRIVYQHGTPSLVPVHVEQLPTPAIGPSLHASDHDGLITRFALGQGDLETSTCTVHSACAILLPQAHLEPVQTIRKTHDKGFKRWMPHMNLLYPFVPGHQMDQAAEKLAPILRQISPFEITMADFDTFTHAKSHTVWLAPEPAYPIVQMQSMLVEALPNCAIQTQDRTQSFCPHMSVAQFRGGDHAAMRSAIQSWQKQWKEIRYPVSEIALIERSKETPFVIKRRLPLGNQGGIESVLWTVTHNNNTSNDALAWMERLNTISKTLEIVCEDIGSTRLGTDLIDSDLDFVLMGHEPAQVGLKRFATALSQLPDVHDIQMAIDARVPAVRCMLGERPTDFIWAEIPKNVSLTPMAWSDDIKNQLCAQKALDGIWMAQCLHEWMSSVGDYAVVRQTIRVIKSWAKAQQIYGTAWGYWGGVSWTIAVLWVASQVQFNTTHQLLLACFERLAGWSWPFAIGKTARADATGPGAHMPVLSPLDDNINTSRAMSKSTALVMQRALVRAWRQSRSIKRGVATWQTVMEAPTITQSQGVMITGEAGAVERVVMRIVMALERVGEVRPWPFAMDDGRWFIALQNTTHGAQFEQVHIQRQLEQLALPAGLNVSIFPTP